MRNQCPPPTRGMLLSFCEKGCYNMPLAISREFYLCFSYHSEAFLCLHVNVSMSFSFSVSISKSIVYFVLWTRNTAIFSLLGRWSINQKIMLIVGSFFLINFLLLFFFYVCVRACVAKMVAYESHDLGWILFVGPQPVTTLGLDCLVRQVYWIHIHQSPNFTPTALCFSWSSWSWGHGRHATKTLWKAMISLSWLLFPLHRYQPFVYTWRSEL